MGFDANEAMQELDGRRVMQEFASANTILRQYQKQRKTFLDSTSTLQHYQKTALGFSAIDQLQRSIQGSMSPRACYELAQEWLGKAENGRPTVNRANHGIRVLMRFCSQVHNTL